LFDVKMDKMNSIRTSDKLIRDKMSSAFLKHVHGEEFFQKTI